MEQITPYLLYEDVAAALDWLSAAFGFKETLRFTEPDGRVSHAEMDTSAGGHFMLGQPGSDYLHVMVDDVDAHAERAKAAGATLLAEPSDKEYGFRGYGAEDLEGHRWDFATQLREVQPEEWGATRGG